MYYRTQMFGLRSAQGRLEELEDIIGQSVDEYPELRVFRCDWQVSTASWNAKPSADSLPRPSCRGFRRPARDEEWLFGMTLLAPYCSFLGDSPGPRYGWPSTLGLRISEAVGLVRAGTLTRIR